MRSISRACIWRLLNPYWHYIAGLCLVSLYLGIDPSIFSYLLKSILDSLVQVKTGGDVYPLILGLVLYIGTGVICVICFRLYDWCLMRLKPALERDIAQGLMEHLLGQAHQFYQDHLTGSIISKIDDVAESIPELVEIICCRIFFRLITIVAGILMLWYLMPTIAIILGVWAVGFMAGVLLIAGRIHSYSEAAAEDRTHATGAMTDTVGNMLSVRLFSAQRLEQGRLSHMLRDWVAAVERRDWFIIKFYIILSIWWLLRDIAGVWCITDLFLNDRISIGDVALFISLSIHFTMILWDLTQDITKSIKLIGKITQGLRLLLTPHEIVNYSKAPALTVSRGMIQFDQVSFGYKRQPLFHGLSVTIEPGQKIGLVGYSGAGKTTFVNLLLRLYDVHSGVISIDGQNIAASTQESLREQIAFIPQEPSLFHRTIMENIRYGNPSASDQEVIAAAQRAHADEFITQIPDGYYALVGDRGVKLSGGQRQRIAIARAFLKPARILVLDEATSALDSVTERYIQESFVELMSDRTTLVIAHRLATLLSMDRILVFEAGSIVEDGSHVELLKQDGKYAAMWKAQSGGFLPIAE